jgi:hypothetical protein
MTANSLRYFARAAIKGCFVVLVAVSFGLANTMGVTVGFFSAMDFWPFNQIPASLAFEIAGVGWAVGVPSVLLLGYLRGERDSPPPRGRASFRRAPSSRPASARRRRVRGPRAARPHPRRRHA